MTERASIAAAARALAGRVRQTPVLTLEADDLAAIPLTLKLELVQHTGSFKPRGAFNRILAARAAGDPALAGGVIAASGGNHGAAVAYAARALGLAAEIFVPEPTPAAKQARIAASGARLVATGADYAAALAASQVRQRQTGALAVHAYDDAAVIAGQGTVGLELAAQAPELTHVLVAAGGGGLLAGIAAWYAGAAEVIGVEPEACPTLHAARAAGRPVPVATGGIAADSLGAREAGALVFPIVAARVAALLLVPDAAIAEARARLWERLRLLVEPGGAAALAALLAGVFVPPPGARVGVVLCGANTGTLPDAG
ncbi:MAG: serine/threonine dehydratase [Acetobacteraceae bacterium]